MAFILSKGTFSVFPFKKSMKIKEGDKKLMKIKLLNGKHCTLLESII